MPLPPRHALLRTLLLLLALSTCGSAITIPGDPADGRIRFDTSSVDTTAVAHAIGHRGSGGSELTTSIYLFALPDLQSGDISTATLQFSLLSRVGDFLTDPAAADIWGLGYTSTTTIDPAWHLLGDTDTRTGNDLGTGIGSNAIVKIADDFLTSDSNDPSPDSYRLAHSSPDLAAFLKLLYDQGAEAGDHAIIRINLDTPTGTTDRGFDLASADAADPATHPSLTINENSVLLFDPFTDGDRTNGTDPGDTDWFKITSSLDLIVQDDTAGIGDGNALEVVMNNTGRRFLGHFPPVTLANPGDFIQLRCTIRPTFAIAADEGFRIGLSSSNGTLLTADTTVSSEVSTHTGYVMRMSTDANGDLSTVGVTNGFLQGTIDFLARNPGALQVTATQIYDVVYTITRSSADQMTTRCQLGDATTTVVVNGMDPGTDLDPPDLVFYDTFDTVGIGASSGTALDFRLDNVLIETNVSTTREHVQTTVEAVRIDLPTEPGISYQLESSPTLPAAPWSDTGYILTGNGSSLRFHDLLPGGTGHFYRATSGDLTVDLFTEDLAAFNSIVDLGTAPDDGAVVSTPPFTCPFGSGNALRMFDFNPADKPELQGELATAIDGPFRMSFRSCNESQSTNASPAIRWRMANTGQSVTSAGRTAFSLSWHADRTFSASYLTVSNTTGSLASPPQPSGVHDVVVIGNGSTTATFPYNLFGQSRTLDPVSYDVYLDGVLFNSAAEFSGGLGFSTNNTLSNYDPALGLQRFGLLGSSSSDTDPDVWFDDILLVTPWSSDGPEITQTTIEEAQAFSFTSESGVLHKLQHTTAPAEPFSVWQDAGLDVLGNGATQLLYDPAGYDPAKAYRIIDAP